MIRQLATPIYMIIQSVFIFLQYRLVSLNLGQSELNVFIIILACAVPFQLFSFGMGNLLYADKAAVLGSQRQIWGLRIVLEGALLGLILLYLGFEAWGVNFSKMNLLFLAIFLISANVMNYLFFCFDSAGLSYLRSLVGILVSLVFTACSFLFEHLIHNLTPIIWVVMAYVLISSTLASILFIRSRYFIETQTGRFDRRAMITEGFKFNIMIAPSLLYDFAIKSMFVILSPGLLASFDITNKIIQQIGSLIAMTNQAVGYKTQGFNQRSLAKLLVLNGCIFILLILIVERLMPQIITLIGVKNYSQHIFNVVLIGWLFNTFAIGYYFHNIFYNPRKNIFANILMLLLLAPIVYIVHLLGQPLYVGWALTIAIGGVFTIGIKTLIGSLRLSQPLLISCIFLMGIALLNIVYNLSNQIIVLIAVAIIMYLSFKALVTESRKGANIHVK